MRRIPILIAVVLVILVLYIGVQGILKIFFDFPLEWGSIADWAVGLGLLMFAFVEVCMNYLGEERNRIRPHIKTLVQKVFPTLLKKLEENQEETIIGHLRIFIDREGKVNNVLSPIILQTELTRDERRALSEFAPDIFDELFEYDNAARNAKAIFTKYAQDAYDLLKEFIIPEKDKGQFLDLDISQIMRHCIGLSIDEERYASWDKQGSIWTAGVEKIKEKGWHKLLKNLTKKDIHKTLLNIHSKSIQFGFKISHRYDQLALEYGIERTKT